MGRLHADWSPAGLAVLFAAGTLLARRYEVVVVEPLQEALLTSFVAKKSWWTAVPRAGPHSLIPKIRLYISYLWECGDAARFSN